MSKAGRLGSVQGKGRAGPGPRRGGRKPVGCVELAMTHRPGLVVLRASCWRPGSVVGPQRPLGHCSPAPRPMPPAGNWLRFSCSIPPLFVLSHSLPMVNTMGKLALFWRFSITASSLLFGFTGQWLCYCHFHAASRPTHPATSARTSGVRSCADPPRWLLPDTDRRIGKDRTGPDLDERPLYLVCHRTRRFLRTKSILFFPARRRPTVDHSLVAGGAQLRLLQA